MVNRDGSIDRHVEPERGGKPNETHHQEQSNRDQAHVTKIQNVGRQAGGFQLPEVDKRIQKDNDRNRTTVAEGAPPPAIVFSAELKVCQEDRNLSTNDYENHKDKE
jgi:hypothetical protein